MNALRSWLKQLTHPDVSEFAVATGRRPSIKISGAFQPVDASSLSTDDILALLSAMGGGRFLETLGPKPSQWSVRVDGIGSLSIVAARQGEMVQARVTLAQKPAATASSNGSQELQVPLQEPQRPAPRAPEVRRSSSTEIPIEHRSGPAVPIELDVDHGVAAARRDLREEPLSERGAALRARTPPPEPRAQADTRAARPAAPGMSAARPAPASALDALLSTAREEGASDLHVVAGRPALLRTGGELLPHGEPLSPSVVEALLLARVPPRLSPTLAAEGSCDFAMDLGALGRFRVNISRQRTGYKGCFRLIAREMPTLASLGLPDAIGLATRHHQGLIVITGPTGHGKTTTMTAIVDVLNRETSHHIITVEDPVEFRHPRAKAMISQREIGTHTRSFESALKASLREDPDVIVVGELRDTETVRMALSASETGHLVIGTMNTPSAAKTIDRLIDLFPPGDQQQVRVSLAGGLRLIVSQRLLPRKEGKNMVAAAEILPGSVPLWNLIRDNKTFQIPSLQQRGKGLGIIRLDDSLAELVRAGKVTLEAALIAAEAPDELEAVLAGRRANAIHAPNAPPPEAPKPTPEQAGKGLLGRAGALFGKKGG